MLKRSQQYSEVFEPILHGVLGPAERLGQAFGFTVAADLADLADIADIADIAGFAGPASLAEILKIRLGADRGTAF